MSPNKKILAIVFGWLVVINLFALVSANRLNLVPDDATGRADFLHTNGLHSWNIVALHARWDSDWYLFVAKAGYLIQPAAPVSDIVFFPAYPGVMRALSLIFGGNLVLAGWLASVIFLFLATWYLARLVREFHPDVDPSLTVMFLLMFPTAFFLNAVYAESLFLFLSVAAIYHGRKGEYAIAALLGFFAALTRITGVLLLFPLAYECYLRYRAEGRFKKISLSLLAIPAGTFSFFLYHYLRFGSFLLFFRTEAAWGRAGWLRNDDLVFGSHAAMISSSFDIFFTLVGILLAYLIWRRVRASYGMYCALTILVAVASGSLWSMGRYLLVLFPIFILFASIKNEYARNAIVFSSILLLALFTQLFAAWYWVD